MLFVLWKDILIIDLVSLIVISFSWVNFGKVQVFSILSKFSNVISELCKIILSFFLLCWVSACFVLVHWLLGNIWKFLNFEDFIFCDSSIIQKCKNCKCLTLWLYTRWKQLCDQRPVKEVEHCLYLRNPLLPPFQLHLPPKILTVVTFNLRWGSFFICFLLSNAVIYCV